MSKSWKIFLVFLIFFLLASFMASSAHADSQCPICPYQENPQGSQISSHLISKSFNTQFSPLVLFSGLAAAFNPCAIGIILMLAGYCIIFQKRPNLVLKIGLIFISTLVIVYFLLGWAFYNTIVVLQSFSYFKLVFQIIRYLISFILIFMGLLGVKDMFWPLYGFSFRLPKRLVNSIFRFSDSISGLLLSAITIGIFGLPCSLAVYLGTLSLLPGTLSLSNLVFYLLIFVAAFSLPLVLILLLTYFYRRKITTLKEIQEKADRYLRGIVGLGLLVLGIVLLIR